MAISLSTLLRASTVLAVIAIAQPANAGVALFQTATIDPNALPADNTFALQGDGTTANSFFFGADFTVSQPNNTVLAIGAAFADTANQASTGSIFGAIVTVDPVTGLPTQDVENLASITLADVVFTPTQDGDTFASLSQPLQLQAGVTYGVVFGSGLFGATGVADLLTGEDAVGSPSIFEAQFSDFAQDAQDTDIRLLVETVPEPGSLALVSAGLLFAGLGARCRRV